jgi:hypothetical protein
MGELLVFVKRIARGCKKTRRRKLYSQDTIFVQE